MDLNTLSLFLQSSLAYECTACKLYFGTEDQLFSHHKLEHSRRFKVSLNPGLQLTEDRYYNASDASSSTVAQEEPAVKLQRPWSSSPSTSNTLNTTFPNRRRDRGDGDDDEPIASKRIKTEIQQDSDLDDDDESGDASGEEDDKAGAEGPPSPSDVPLLGLNNGQYGYLTEAGFHPFTLEELKKFAVQIVALFKLDESQHSSADAGVSTGQSPTSQKDDTTSTTTPGPGPSHFHNHSATSSFSWTTPDKQPFPSNITHPPGEIPKRVEVEEGVDPAKSCYKCGQRGHMAWGCPNPRVAGLAPKRRRRKKRKRNNTVS